MKSKTSKRCRHVFRFILALILISSNYRSVAAGWWSFTKDGYSNDDRRSENSEIPKDTVTEFSLELLHNAKGIENVDKARKSMVSSSSCTQNAYRNLFAGCSEILANEESRKRFAWHLSDCFQKGTGRPDFPYCDAKASMLSCLQKLSVDAHRVFLEYHLHTDSLCHQLQADAFKRQMERLVNELKKTAENAETKIEIIDERAEQLLESSNQIQESLTSVDVHTEQVAQTLKNVGDSVSTVLINSEAVHEQFDGIAASQLELREGQAKMNETLEGGMAMLHDSYNDLGAEISNLGNKAVEIESQIGKVGDVMSSKMNILQSKAEDIGSITEISLDKQSELLAGQSAAVQGLQTLNAIMSQALEESKGTMQQIAELGHKQQEELLLRQKQLERAHDHLVENSKTILAAQEAFELKQTSMFVALEKLFNLHNAILLESRVMKAFLIYSVAIFILYMLTSTNQTYNLRPRLYMGLCFTFLIEFFILKYWTNGIEHHTWITNVVRLLFAALSFANLLYAVFTYRDYVTLTYHNTLKLVEKFDGIEKHKEFPWEMDSEDEDLSSFIIADYPEDVDKLEDPDFMLPEEVGENSNATNSITRRYNLRHRNQS